jgi:hypothetical protein
MRTRCLWLALVAVAQVVSWAPPVSAADGCASGKPPAWFLGVVNDGEADADTPPREDFVLDVDNFEAFLQALRSTYCIPETAAAIYAFDGTFERNGRLYPAGSEINVKRALRDFGPQARVTEDSTFFFFLSSHGIADVRFACPGGTRAVGSLSGLRSGFGQDGDLYDCELGAELNTNFGSDVAMAIYADCSLCGGFSDSLTAVSGTVPDGSVPVPSGILGPNRVVVTGCAVTTECTGGSSGGRMYSDMIRRLTVEDCDGWTAPNFPSVQGIGLPQRTGPQDGRCTASELHFAAVNSSYGRADLIAIQQQYRIKYGPASLADDVAIL